MGHKSHGNSKTMTNPRRKMGIVKNTLKLLQVIILNKQNNPYETTQLFDQFLWNRRKTQRKQSTLLLWECLEIDENFIFETEFHITYTYTICSFAI